MQLKTSRGIHDLALAREPEISGNAMLLTLAMERRDGIEKIAFQCRIASDLVGEDRDPGTIVRRLVPFLEHEFEMTREHALKSIRGEGKLFTLIFDESNRGPF